MSATTPFHATHDQMLERVEALTEVGVRLSKVSQRTADRLIRQQAKMLTGSVDAVMTHFQAAAGASDIKELLLTQTRLVPADTSRSIGDARDMADIMFSATAEVRDIVFGAIGGLRGDSDATAAKAASAPVRKRARKASPKPAAKKAAAAA